MSKILTKQAKILGLVGSSFIGGWCAKTFLDQELLPMNTVSAKTIIPQDNVNVPSIASSTKPQRISQIMKYGFPSLDSLRSFDDFVLSYDRRNRTAYWVFEHLTKENTAYSEIINRSNSEFFEDESIHEFFRSRLSDYKYSGYDRGHLAAAGNHKANQKHLDQTFVLSNTSPQVGAGFNRDKWAHLEKHARKLIKQYPNVYVCTGPLYLPMKSPNGKKYVNYEVIGDNNVAVPTHFFKIIVGEREDGKLIMENYVMPNALINDSEPLTSFMVRQEGVSGIRKVRIPVVQVDKELCLEHKVEGSCPDILCFETVSFAWSLSTLLTLGATNDTIKLTNVVLLCCTRSGDPEDPVLSK